MTASDDDSDWQETEGEPERCHALFTDEVFPTIHQVLINASNEHGFDFRDIHKKLDPDFIDYMKLINFIRSLVKEGAKGPEILAKALADNGSAFKTGDKYAIPAIEDDAVLFRFEQGLKELSGLEIRASGKEIQVAVDEVEKEQKSAPLAEDSALRTENTQLRKAVVEISSALKSISGQADTPTDDEIKQINDTDNDSAYFDSYSYPDIHEEMLRDEIRTCSYRDFMYKNPHLFKDKVVLDIGCGSGILSLFAAKSGAKRVIGIDMAEIVEKAKQVVIDNGYEKVITLIRGKVEEVSLPADIDKVDIIVSEWMGYFLLYESMLPTVLYARDKWLKKGGGCYPDEASMHILGSTMDENVKVRKEWWKDVYGFNLSAMITDDDFVDGIDEVIPTDEIITGSQLLKTFDINTVESKDLDFTSEFKLHAQEDSRLDAFVVYFETPFQKDCKHPIILSTSPFGPETHWKQTSFSLRKSFDVRAGEVIKGKMKATRSHKNPRNYEVVFNFKVGAHEEREEKFILR